MIIHLCNLFKNWTIILEICMQMIGLGQHIKILSNSSGLKWDQWSIVSTTNPTFFFISSRYSRKLKLSIKQVFPGAKLWNEEKTNFVDHPDISRFFPYISGWLSAGLKSAYMRRPGVIRIRAGWKYKNVEYLLKPSRYQGCSQKQTHPVYSIISICPFSHWKVPFYGF